MQEFAMGAAGWEEGVMIGEEVELLLLLLLRGHQVAPVGLVGELRWVWGLVSGLP